MCKIDDLAIRLADVLGQLELLRERRNAALRIIEKQRETLYRVHESLLQVEQALENKDMELSKCLVKKLNEEEFGPRK